LALCGFWMSANDLFHIKSKSVTTTLSVESLRFSQIYFLAICLFYATKQCLQLFASTYTKGCKEYYKHN
ncbi:hypothetical protein ABH158_01795, partial [Bacteroides ovatus]